MLKIGEFSKLSRISVRMLRHYDEMGLLTPVEIDRFTGYRYYAEEQLIAAGRIASLRDMGFGLAAIGVMLASPDDRETAERMMDEQLKALAAEQKRVAAQMRLLRTAKEKLRKDEKAMYKDEKTMHFDVTLKTIPERYAACVRMTLPDYTCEGLLWSTLLSETARMDIREADPCLCAVAYLDAEYKEENVDCEAQKTVAGSYPDTEHVRFKTLPAVRVASTTIKGSYAQLGEANTAVAQWMRDNGYDFAGPSFNIYHVSPHDTKNPEEFVTELCYPVK